MLVENPGRSIVKIVSTYFEERIRDWPLEKQEEARRSLEAFASGTVQSLIGNVRRAFVDKFLNTVGPLEKIKIEFIADQIVAAKDSNRLHQKTIIGLAAAFESGIKYAFEATKRGEDPGDIVESLHKNVVIAEAENIVGARRSKQ